MNKELVLIGKILSTHGLIGNVKLQSFFEEPMDIFNYNLYDKNGNIISCEKICDTSKFDTFIVHFKNINSIDETKEYRNFEIFIKRDDLEDIGENEVYINDLIGMQVDCTNKKGVVCDVYNYGAGDVIEIKWENGKIESIPFVNNYVKQVDKINKIIYIETPKYI